MQSQKRNSKKVFKRPSTLKAKYGRKKINVFKKKSRVLEKAY